MATEKWWSEVENNIPKYITQRPYLKILADEIDKLFPKGYTAINIGSGWEANALRALKSLAKSPVLAGVCIDHQPFASVVHESGFKSIVLDLNESDLPCLDASFDVVILQDVLEHLMDPLRVLKEASRILKSGGILFITTPNIATLKNRVKLLIGQSPLCPLNQWLVGCRLKVDNKNVFDGHYREYTVKEIRIMLDIVKLKIRTLKLFGTTQKAIHISYHPNKDLIAEKDIEVRLSQNRFLFKSYQLLERLIPSFRYEMFILAEKETDSIPT